MATTVQIGKKVADIELLDLFQAAEGEITQRYGRIGQGKTYGAVVDILDELSLGHVVYTNFHLNFNGFDQRKSIIYLIGGILFPWKKRYFNFPKENLHFIAVDADFVTNFGKLTDCSVYLDEGHVVFDSYEMAKMSMEKRVSVLHTRHFDRSIHIISQRPTAVHRMMRANVNRFYKYEKLVHFGNFILFRRTEYQDMTDETVDEAQPVSTKLYIGSKKIMYMYDSKYLRGDTPDSQKVSFEAYDVSFFQKLKLLGVALREAFRRAQ